MGIGPAKLIGQIQDIATDIPSAIREIPVRVETDQRKKQWELAKTASRTND